MLDKQKLQMLVENWIEKVEVPLSDESEDTKKSATKINSQTTTQGTKQN